MKRTMMGLCVAAAFGFVASLGAQSATSTTSSEKDVTVTGCLERGASGTFMLANAHKDSGMTGTSTGTTGTSGSAATTGSATGSSAMSARSGGETWTLEGSSSDLDKHVGHKIEVTGKELPSSSTSSTGAATTGTTGTTATGTAGASHSAMSAQKLDVKSVKMVSTSCS
jgi:hypothetical protein